MYLDGLNQTARTNRLIIISRIEIEVEEIGKQARDCRNADQSQLIATLSDLNKELERLRKIVYPCTNN
jgi:flagellar motility protein MotE (MotC chaperone)